MSRQETMQGADDTGTTAWFVERFGVINDNLPRTASRMFALFLVEGGPFSFSQLAERLQVSRGNVSMSSRMLEQAGMIERITRAGDRQDYFQVVEQPWHRMIEHEIAKQQKARSYAATLLATNPDLPADARHRIDELVALIDGAIRSMSSMIGQD